MASLSLIISDMLGQQISLLQTTSMKEFQEYYVASLWESGKKNPRALMPCWEYANCISMRQVHVVNM